MQNLLLKNGLIYDMESGHFSLKDILIEDGNIKQVSEGIFGEGEDINVLDLKEGYVMPGWIDCHTHIGIIEEGVGKLGLDNNEKSDPVTPHIRAIDGVNPMDIAFKDAMKSGVTTVMTGPGSSNAIGEQNIVVKTCGNVLDQMIVKSPSGLKIALGDIV